MHLVTVLLKVVLDAALKEVQFGLQLIRLCKHGLVATRQAGVVVKQTQPANGDTVSWHSLDNLTVLFLTASTTVYYYCVLLLIINYTHLLLKFIYNSTFYKP